ncbi:hypothetical protein P8452_55508 [Trifolium repens]|nr:hypothetical protein P8452_55508 [Trifolium repens]
MGLVTRRRRRASWKVQYGLSVYSLKQSQMNFLECPQIVRRPYGQTRRGLKLPHGGGGYDSDIEDVCAYTPLQASLCYHHTEGLDPAPLPKYLCTC